MTRSLLQQALDALRMAQVELSGNLYAGVRSSRVQSAITALREALAAPMPEPWMPIETAPKSNEKVLLISLSGGIRIDTGGFAHHLINAAKVDGDECFLTHWMPLPAAPGAAPPAAPAPVVPLTDEQLARIAVEDEFLLYCDQDSFNEIARAIEQAHGIGGGGNG